MSSSSTHGIRRWRSRAAIAVLPTGALLAATISGVASAAPESAAAAADCPDPFPVAELTEGMDVNGLTVSHGTQPDEFTGKIVGTLDDGIAPGVDMIIARLKGSEITDPETGDVWRGIWAGMSGSPVYAPDGRLIGAVSYGLSYSPSDYAGITPAAEMYKIRDFQSDTATARRSVEIPSGIAREMRSDGVTQRQVDSGYHQLPTPRAMSGLPQQRMERAAKQADYSGRRGLVAGPKATAKEDPIPIAPGSNLVASQSYGDVTYAGTGTATAICDGDVLGFGHPFWPIGKSTYSMHGANALYVETDMFDGSYKISNPAAPAGAIVQDRLAGILGRADVTPPSTVVTSRVSATNGVDRNGRTTITEELFVDDIPWIAMTHLLANEDRVFQAYTKGSATLRWTVEMKRPNGTTLQYTRQDKFANASDITYATVWDLYSEIWRIVSNRFVDVKVTDIHLRSSLDEAYRAYSLGKVQRFKGGQWNTLKPGGTIKAKSGSTLVLRGWLSPRPDSAVKGQWVRLRIPVGSYAQNRRGQLTVSGGSSTRVASKATSLPQLLDAMAAAPKNASVWGKLKVSKTSGGESCRGCRAAGLKQRHVPAPAPVGGSKSVTVRIIK